MLGQAFGPEARKPEYTYLKGDITAAYSAKVREVRRSFVFLNLDEAAVPAALIVFDRVVSADPAFQKYWLLQSVTQPAIQGSTAVVTLSGNGWRGKLVNTTVLPEPGNARIATVGGPGKEFWVFGKNYPNATVPADPEAGGWRVEVSPKRPAAADLFLNVMQVMDRDNGRALAVEKVRGAGAVGVRLADRVVLFNPAGDRASKTISFTVPGQEQLCFLVADLAEGTWQVWRGGQIAQPALTVSADAGVLYFKGPPGAYTLRR